jgi:hypothetical protein
MAQWAAAAGEMGRSAKEGATVSIRSFFAVLLLGAASSIPAGCSSKPELPPPTSQEERIGPEQAKEALLRMMRSKPGQDLGWFNGEIPDEMSKLWIEEKGGGWYCWTAAFSFNPSEATYTFVARPRPGTPACVFEYKGSFVREGGRWSATPPELVQTALQGDK